MYELKYEIIFTAGYPQIFSDRLIRSATCGAFGSHPSLLPKYKGLGPIFQALLHNENEIGFSFHYIDEDVDTGEIIKRQKIKTEKNESVSHIAIRAHVVAGYELLSILNNLKKGDKKTEQITQDNGNYFSWPEKKDVKKFMQSNKKYVEFRDFLSLVFYNPKKF